MIALLGRMKALCYFLAVLICAELFPAVVFAADDQISVRNVRYEMTGELVRIYYDLTGPLDRVHKVSLYLRREGDSSFGYRPVYLTGDVGTIVFPGDKRRITWDFLKDFPDGLKGDDFYFTVEAEMVQTPGINRWYWIGGGAAVVGGVLAIVLLSKGGTNPPPPPDPGFPTPPGRPQ
jgi:hypothetical protein